MTARRFMASPPGSISLFNHFVGAQQELFWNGQTDRFRRRVVDDKVELDRLLDWDIGRLRTAQNLVDVICGSSEQVWEVGAVGQQTSGYDIFPKRVYGRQFLGDRQGIDANPIRGEERIATNIERIGNAVEPLEAGYDLLGFCDFEFERLLPKLGPV